MAKGIQAEIKQNKPFATLEDEFFSALMRTADHLDAQVASLLKPYELSPTQYNALRILRGAGPDGLACNEIGVRMLTHDPDITRLLGRLEKRGLAERRRGQADRRVITTRITPAGLELLKSLDRPVAEHQRKLLGNLGDSRLQSLLRVMQTIRERAA